MPVLLGNISTVSLNISMLYRRLVDNGKAPSGRVGPKCMENTNVHCDTVQHAGDLAHGSRDHHV